MRDYGNLWENVLEDDELNTTDNVVPLMTAQCEYLGIITHGCVSGRFEPMKNPTIAGVVYPEAQLSMQRAMKVFANAADPEQAHLVNANELYESQKFAFDICTKRYRFRLLTLVLGPIYPISLDFDDGVFEEAGGRMSGKKTGKGRSEITVNNDDELMECFETAVSTKKVKYILKRLVRESKNSVVE